MFQSIKLGFSKALFLFIVSFWILFFCNNIQANDRILHVLAAENMYGNIAQQLGGQYVNVDVILNNPDQDPHLFELTPKVSQKLNQADIIIVNGLGYDHWLDHMLSSYHFKENQIISVEKLLKAKEGDNPHLWYNLDAVSLLANQLEQQYSHDLSKEKTFFAERLKSFQKDIQDLQNRVQVIRNHYPNVSVAATEPVFGLMAKNLGFHMMEEPYQWTVMNGGEPTPRQVAQFEQDLKTRKVDVLFYNDQVSTPATEKLKKIAEDAHIAVIGVSETMPAKLNYQQWMGQVLDNVEVALKSKPQ